MPSFSKKVQLFIIKQFIDCLNFILLSLQKVLFGSSLKNPKNILIYRIGNIGDIVCSVPALIAIRRAYPKSKIILLTSPGDEVALGAKELLTGVWYLDELKIYYADDIDSWSKKINFIRNLRKNHYDLFIQISDDLARFRIFLRNIIFAKCIGVKSAFGFKIRTTRLFYKTQIDYLFNKTEIERLLDILEENDIKIRKVEFDFNISFEQKNRVKSFLKEKWGNIGKKEIIVVVNPGGKKMANQWPIKRFAQVVKYLQNRYGAKIIVIGGKNDIGKAREIEFSLNKENILIAAGKLNLLETFELLNHCSFLISNDTGAAHMASAVALPVIGLYGVGYVYGKWFPYGHGHKILYHKFIDCDYRTHSCIQKSIENISIEEVMMACDKIICKL